MDGVGERPWDRLFSDTALALIEGNAGLGFDFGFTPKSMSKMVLKRVISDVWQ